MDKDKREYQIRKVFQKQATDLLMAIYNYEQEQNEETTEELEIQAILSNGIPLPSKRFGNAIAFALETDHLIAAEYLIIHAEELGIDLKKVSKERDNPKRFNLEEEYQLARSILEKKQRQQGIAKDGIEKIIKEKVYTYSK